MKRSVIGKELSKTQKIIILSILSFIILVFGLKINCGPDTYGAMVKYDTFWKIPFRNGRLFHALFYLVIGFIAKFSINIAFYFSWFLTFVFFIVAEYKCSVLWLQYIKDKSIIADIACTILSVITILNIFSTEFFMLPETNPTWGFAIWMGVEAVYSFSKYLYKKNYKNIVISFLCLLAAVFSYQTLTAVFVVLAVPLIFLHCDKIKSFIWLHIVVGALYAIPMASNLIYTKVIMNNERAGGEGHSIVESAIVYLPEGKTPDQFILDRITVGMWGYALLCILMAVVLVYNAIRKQKKVEIARGVYISFVVVFMGILPFVTQMSDDYSPRLYYPLGMLLGILITYGIHQGLIETDTLSRSVVVIVLTVTVIIQIFSNGQIFIERYLTNYDDMSLAKVYGEYISEYEEENNTKVKYVCFYQDSIRTKYIDDEGWCLSQRVFGVSWGNIEALNFYLNSEYASGVYESSIADYFANKNWNVFSKEQLIFDGETVHICKY